MALTNLIAISRAISRLNEAGTPVILPPDVLPLIMEALERFARNEAKIPETAQLLRKDFSVTVSAGVGSLTASLTAAEPLLAECLSSAYVVSSAGVQFHYLQDRVQLNLARPMMIPYFINDQGTLRTRNTDGSLTSLNTTMTITSQYIPAIGSVPSQREEVFLNTLAEVIRERVPQAQEMPVNA